MPDTVSIAAINFLVRPVHDFDEFAQHVRGLLDQAEGADLVLLPELFTVELFTTEPTWRTDDIADLTRIDAYTDDYRALFTEEARRRGQHIAAGSHLMKRGDRHLNVACLFTPEGTVHEHELQRISVREGEGGMVHLRGRRAEGDRPAVRQGRLRRLLRGGDPGGLLQPRRAGRGDHPVPLVHLHRARLLAGTPLRRLPCDREPGVLRALLDRRFARRSPAERLDPQFHPRPV